MFTVVESARMNVLLVDGKAQFASALSRFTEVLYLRDGNTQELRMDVMGHREVLFRFAASGLCVGLVRFRFAVCPMDSRVIQVQCLRAVCLVWFCSRLTFP